MSSDDKQIVLDTRKKNKEKGKSPHKGRQASEVGTKIKDIKSQMAELKRTIASLSKSKTADADGGGESDTPDNAGDAFGGRQQKKQRKE